MKFLYGYFNQNTGQSIVALADKYGQYIGQAKLHPDDRKYASKYTGCRIAEQRAYIKALKQKIRRKKIELNTLIELKKEIKNYTTKKTEKHIYLKIKKYTNDINYLKQIINQIEKEIKTSIKIRDNIINKK